MATNFSVGTMVRSFDFSSRALTGIDANYIEGIVEDNSKSPYGTNYYQIRVTKAVRNGFEWDFHAIEVECGEDYVVCPPMNGLATFSGETNGVEAV